ncbi:MAG: glutamate--cysteine ligase [Actinomycetota bacterium]|nr:glutamate--cysteine ligase [Actinomycetota bacterium]
MSVRKIGVEEELLLVDPDTRRLTAVSTQAVAANDGSVEVAEELFLHQIETSTPATVDATELMQSLRAGRRAVGEAAAAAGARAVATATPPLPSAMDDEFTPRTRYARIQAEFGEIARQATVCAMHVHVDVADDDEGVAILDRLAPWLPFLLAISANSPYCDERDTGHASWRSQVWNRLPTAGPRQAFGDLASYRAAADRMIDWGGALDAGMLYFDVRLSESYPTLEVRVADVCTDLQDALLVALVTRALAESVAGDPEAEPWRADLLRVAGWRAARYGLAGDLVHPTRSVLAPPRDVFDAVLKQAGPALEAAGDHEFVVAHFDELMARGTGATRQRRVFEQRGELTAVVDDLADLTEASWT